MLKAIKQNLWTIIGAVIVFAVILFLRDLDRIEEIKSFFRRKAVEDDVNKLKESLAKEDATIANKEQQLVELAEELKNKKVKVEEASDEEIKDFYDNFFNRG